MTVDAARRTRRRTPAPSLDPEPMVAPAASIAIGEIDQTIFECPSCSRPLALGVHRCPACGTRLIAGVALGKASAFVVVGLAVGLVSGVAGGMLFGLTHAAPAAAAIAAHPSGPPVTGSTGGGTGGGPTPPAATPSVAPTPAPTDPAGMPPVTRTALTQVVGTNERLAESEAALRAALRASAFDASGVAQILRSLSADSVFGQQVAVRIEAWSGSSALGGRLDTFYSAVHGTAADGLLASVQNKGAYRNAATAMIKLLDGLPALDAEIRLAAESAGLDLPAASTAPGAP